MPVSPDRAQSSAVREYAADETVVVWLPALCIHSGNCVSWLPGVFDTKKRPWVNVRGASAAEGKRTVASGALRSRRL